MSRESGEPSSTAYALVAAFTRVGPAYMRWVESRRPDEHLSYARMRTLATLHCDGERPLKDLAATLDITARRVTALVEALEADGLVTRRPHPTDGRSTLVAVTPAGSHAFESHWQRHQHAVAQLFTRMSDADQRHLLQLLGTLDNALRAATGGSADIER